MTLKHRTKGERIAYLQGQLSACRSAIAGLLADVKRERFRARVLCRCIAVARERESLGVRP